MPELLRPDQATYIPVPAQGKPVAQPKQAQQPQPQAAPRDPFRQTPGPALLVLPHVEDQQPSRQSRHGKPVRLSVDDIAALHHGIRGAPTDRARWLVLADAMDEHGKPAFAHALRQISQQAEDRYSGSLSQADCGPIDCGVDADCYGSVAGIPIILGLWRDGKWTVGVRNDGHAQVGFVEIPHKPHGISLLHEMDPSGWSDEAESARTLQIARDRFPLESAHLSRGTPIRLANADDHRAMQAAIKANPMDEAPFAIYADMVAEDGHPHLADALRKAATDPDHGGGAYGQIASAYGAHPVPGITAYVDLLRAGDKNIGLVELGLRGHGPASSPAHFSYTTDDLSHVAGLVSEMRLKDYYPGDADHFKRTLDSLRNPGNRVTLDRGPAGTWLLRHDDGRTHLIQSDWDFPDLARNFGWVPDESRERVAGGWTGDAWDYLSDHEGQSIEDPGYFDGPERMAKTQAPAGGLLSRGIMYPAGEFLPDEGSAPMMAPAAGMPQPIVSRSEGRKRRRIRDAVRRVHGLKPERMSRYTGQTHLLMTPEADGPITYGDSSEDNRPRPPEATKALVYDTFHRIMGKTASEPWLAAISGWVPGTTLRAYPASGGGLLTHTTDTESGGQNFEITRRLHIDPDTGHPAIHNEGIQIYRDAHRGGPNPFKGLSASLLARQIIAAHEMGIPRITTSAAQDPSTQWQRIFNGGLHWGLMGYDGRLSNLQYSAIPRDLRRRIDEHTGGQFSRTRSIFDLVGHPEGRKWWIANPGEFKGFIDTNPMSRTRQRVMDSLDESLKKYQAEQAQPERLARLPEPDIHVRYQEGLEYLKKTGRVHPEHVDLFIN